MRRTVLFTIIGLFLGLNLAGCAGGWRNTKGVKLTAPRDNPTPTANTFFFNDTDYPFHVQWNGLLDPGDHFEVAAHSKRPFVFSGKTGKWREFTITQFRSDYSSNLGQEEKKIKVPYTGLYDVGDIHVTDALILGYTSLMGIIWNNSPEDLVDVRDTQWPNRISLKAGEWTEPRVYMNIRVTISWRVAHNPEFRSMDMSGTFMPPKNSPTYFNGKWYAFVCPIPQGRYEQYLNLRH